MYLLLLDLLAAWLLDWLLGDPRWLPHPVNALGRLIGFLDRRWHPGPAARPARTFRAGLVLTAVVLAAAVGVTAGLLSIAGLVHPVLFHLFNVYLLYAALAGRCMDREARKVLALLPGEPGAGPGRDLEPARRALSMLVSRDTTRLDQTAIVRATVETVAENTVDGVLSPLLWMGVGLALSLVSAPHAGPGGPALVPLAWLPAALAWGFKAASTMDSRIGYRNARYRFFGRAAARSDDALNFLPARLSLFLLPLAAACLRLDARASWRLAWRDRRKHASPNSAHPEAAVAGALGIRLGGPAVYGGRVE